MKCPHFPRLLLPTFFVLLVDRHQEIKKRELAQLVLYNVVIRASIPLVVRQQQSLTLMMIYNNSSYITTAMGLPFLGRIPLLHLAFLARVANRISAHAK